MNTCFFHSLRLSDGTWLFPKAFLVCPLASFNQKAFLAPGLGSSPSMANSVLSHRCTFRLAFTPPTPTDSMSLGIGSFQNSFPLELGSFPPKSMILGYLIRHFHLSN
ncbi:hypothetical protein ES319_D04G095600v1 [Gossypium barbadense]|uniref:Uncharacterized protein n=1 Tax=Gossypium barbadense TaxID=3634 RepID=A0A5J5RW55_GOSBA|nr:hypothetical protein ES319_D04G095600v1 [Gossypium barbadense]